MPQEYSREGVFVNTFVEGVNDRDFMGYGVIILAMDIETLLTIKEAARFLGVSESAIRNAILEGRLPCVTKFGRKLILREALNEYKERTQPEGIKPRGRPRRSTDSVAPEPSSNSKKS